MNYKEIAEELELCWPEIWSKWSATQRAQKVAKRFVDPFTDYWKQVKASREFARKCEKEAKQIRAERQMKYERKMWNIVMKAEQYYGDIVYEWCGGNGRGGPEEEEQVFAKIERGEFDDDACRREALFTAYPDKDFLWYDRIMSYWNKRGW